tara:strand:+ start:349 stop:1572 length:1224 start_codon:yes stop_codon:yes gene_type:complete
MENVAQEKVLNTENDSQQTYKIQKFNSIASVGLKEFELNQFDVSESQENPDAYVLRSHSLHNKNLPMSLLAIGRAGAGVNNIPIPECSSNGIVVFNTPGANANAVKELVIAGMLLSARDIYGGIKFVHTIESKGDEIPGLVESNKSNFKGIELAGKTLGVIGLGAIGIKVANAGLSLGMNVMGHDPFISIDSAWELSRDVEKASNLDYLISNCDFIAVHVPFNEQTKGFINKERISLMKKGAVLLNFSRNSLVDEFEMVNALAECRIHRYVTDFPNPLLVDNSKVISIPHLGASTKEAEDNCAIMACKQLSDYLRNGNIVNSVNFPSCNMARSSDYRISISNTNVPAIIGKITSVIANANINISEMVNKSRGDIAYNLIDLNQTPTKDLIDSIKSIEGILNVRVLNV